MKSMIFVFLFIFGSAANALDRKAYVQEASTEIHTYLVSLNRSDSGFLAGLSKDEATQFQYLLKVTEQLHPAGPELIFSDNPNDFVLSTGEPARSARTTENLREAIYINNQKLNADNVALGYLDVVQILVHELGHKIGSVKVQTAVDSLAVKISNHLRSFYRVEKTYSDGFSGGRRYFVEYIESLSVMKDLSLPNPNPSVFYVARGRVQKINLYFAETMGGLKDRAVQLHTVIGNETNGPINVEVRFTVYKRFELEGESYYFPENTFVRNDFIFVYDGQMNDRNFKSDRRRWVRSQSNWDFEVTRVTELQATLKQVKWQVEFKGMPSSKEIYLVAGTIERNFLIPCKALSVAPESVAVCTFDIPTVTSIYYLDILQLWVDQEVADLPEVIQLPLAGWFKVKEVISDFRGVSFVGDTVTVQSLFPLTQLILRCQQDKPIFKDKIEVGRVNKVIEKVFLKDQLPVQSKTSNEWKLRVSCESTDAKLIQLLITDESGYTYMPSL